ncbi:MAG: hypothetical protein ACREMK_07165 [Gemmatimonadota bacterium]
MTAIEARRYRGSSLLFAGIVAGVYTAAVGVSSRLPHLEGASAVAVGLTLDMTVVVPLAFYLLVVRRRGLPIVMLAPVLVLSVLAASQILPAGHRQPLRIIEVMVVPMELGLLAWIGWRAAGALRMARRDEAADPLEQLRRAAFELLQNDRVAAVFASEIGVFYYAFGAWWARPHVPPGTFAFTQHRRSGHAGIVLAFLLAMSAEGFAAHVLLLTWSAIAAWIFTIGTAYGALWLIADYRATVLRPILVDADCILIRAGFRCSLRVPRARIAEVGCQKPSFGKESFNLTFLSTPTHWLTLSEPMLAQGPYGHRRRVRAIGIKPDLPEEFDRLLDRRPA